MKGETVMKSRLLLCAFLSLAVALVLTSVASAASAPKGTFLFGSMAPVTLPNGNTVPKHTFASTVPASTTVITPILVANKTFGVVFKINAKTLPVGVMGIYDSTGALLGQVTTGGKEHRTGKIKVFLMPGAYELRVSGLTSLMTGTFVVHADADVRP
jgi:hypothetical protein